MKWRFEADQTIDWALFEKTEDKTSKAKKLVETPFKTILVISFKKIEVVGQLFRHDSAATAKLGTGRVRLHGFVFGCKMHGC